MVGTFRLLACVSISFSLLALTACGGGGGGGGGNNMASAPPPVIPAGTFLATSGTTCTTPSCSGPEASFAFTGGAINGSPTSSGGSGSAGNANVTIVRDMNGIPTSVSLNVPAGLGNPNYQNTFNLASASPGNGPLAGFVGILAGQVFSDGSNEHSLVLDPSLTFSSYGLWVHITSVTAGVEQGATGAVAFGQLTPAASIPTTGTFTYTGRTLGAAVDGSTSTLLVGTESLTANFNSMTMTGNFNVSSVSGTGALVSWSNLNMASSSIVSGAYSGALSGTLNGPATALTGTANGNFYGSAAQETAGTWSVSGGTVHAVAGFGAKR